jgi:hypothetical protein
MQSSDIDFSDPTVVSAQDSTWYRVTNPFGHGCCDCGLWHDIAWKVEDGELFLQFNRNSGKTSQLRGDIVKAIEAEAPELDVRWSGIKEQYKEEREEA